MLDSMVALQAVLLFSEFSNVFFGYVDPDYSLQVMGKIILGELTFISAKIEH